MSQTQLVGLRRNASMWKSQKRLGLRCPFDYLASTFLAVGAIPLVLNAGVGWPVAIPLCVLGGLAMQSFFRLVLGAKANDLFDPTTLVAGYFFVYFCLRAWYLQAIPFTERLGRNPYDDYLPAALWCACLGFVAFLAGTYSPIAKRLQPAYGLRWPRAVPVVRIAFLILLGLIALIYLFKKGLVVGNFGSRAFQRNPPSGFLIILSNFPLLSWIAICVTLTLPGNSYNQPVLWPVVILCVAVLAVNLAMSGGKESLIKPLLEALIVSHYLRRRWRIWELIAIGIPTMLISFGVINFYRFVVVGHSGAPKSMANVISRVSSASELLMSSKRGSSDPSAFEQLVNRDAGVDALALIMKYTPHPFPYQYGASLVRFPLVFIPRPLWPNKPVEVPSSEFESAYMAEPRDFNGFSSIHLISDFYRNFGYIGVAAGMFVFGVSLRFLYLLCSPSPGNRAGVFLYAAALPELVHFLELDTASVLYDVAKLIFMLFIVAGFLKIRYQKLASPSHTEAAQTRFLKLGRSNGNT